MQIFQTLSAPKNDLPNSLLDLVSQTKPSRANPTLNLAHHGSKKISLDDHTVFGEFGDYDIKRFESVGSACSRRHLILGSYIAF